MAQTGRQFSMTLHDAVFDLMRKQPVERKHFTELAFKYE